MGVYFNKLKTLVDNGRLSVYVVVAPPRSNSTVMEHIVSISPDIQHACHEPFAAHKKGFEIEDGYKQIYDSIGGQEFEDSGSQTSIVIKEMAHWLGNNKEYENFLTLTNNPVLLLIRNPLLAVESRIRRTIKALDMRPSLSLKKLLDVLGHDVDFQEEFKLLSSAKTISSILPNHKLKDLNNDDIYHKPNILIQNETLDLYAKKKGYFNWHDLIENKLYYERDYKFFELFLQVNKNRLRFEENEFKSLDEIAQYLKQIKHPNIIFDTTDVRAEPEHQLIKICSMLGISFSPEMINWRDRPINIDSKQTAPHEHIWYDELYGSKELKPPTEIPPTLEMFPDFMQQYLIQDNLPIYANLSKEKKLSHKEKKEINIKKIRVKITDHNETYLRSLGVIQAEKPGKDALVELQHIDPIYATTNMPFLANDKKFCLRKNKYLKAIGIVSGIIIQNNEPQTELKFHPRLK